MRAVRIHTQAGPDALVVEDAPYPHTAENDVVIRVHAAGFTPGELDWPGTWKDLAGRDRCPGPGPRDRSCAAQRRHAGVCL